MNNVEYGNMLRSRLLSLRQLRAKPSGDGKWVMLRCPFCGDSRKDLTKTRCYIKVVLTEGEAPLCYCHNCGISVTVDKALPLLFENDYEMETTTQLYYKQVKLSPKHQKINMTKKKNLIISPPLSKEYNVEKIRYINERLGIKLTMKDIVKYKICIDLYQLLAENGVKNLTRDKRITDRFETDYLGFLTINNEYINLRNYKDSYKGDKYLKRYENYNIFNIVDNSRRIYAISNTIDCMVNIEIHIAEGPFDILGVYNHICNKDDKNKLYIAVCGGGYSTVLKNIIMDYGLLFTDIHVYSDNEPEKDIRFYKGVKKELGNRVNSITLYYNELSKDFGVTKDMIKLVKRKV